VCAYHPDHSTIFGYHHGTLLVQSGALVQLQSSVQVAYLTTNSVKLVFLECCDLFKTRGDLEEVANIKTVPNWISYLHQNFWIFSPFLDILINFLKSKIDIDFPKFSFEIHFEYGEVLMGEVVPFSKKFSTIFYLKKFELDKILFEMVKV
jgi:hypothetical protein